MTATDDFSGRLDATVEETWRSLRRTERLHPEARRPALELPRVYEDVLAWAVRAERAEGTPEAAERADHLLRHYLEWMPAVRVEQLATNAEPQATFFHRPLDWGHLPRLRGAIERLYALLEGAGVPDGEALGAPDLRAFIDERPTVAALYERTCFGGFMPMLYAFDADLRSYARELAAVSHQPSAAERGSTRAFDACSLRPLQRTAWYASRGLRSAPRRNHGRLHAPRSTSGEKRRLERGDAFEAVVDRRLAAPLVHELSHLGRHRRALEPPLLDEGVSGWLGVHVLPETAWPAPGEDNALMGAPWFAQIGQALVHGFGLGPILRAHAGVVPWEEVIGADAVEAFRRLGRERWLRGREVHFLGDNTRPWPWLKAIYIAAAGRSLAGLGLDDLEAMSWSEVPASGDPALEQAIVADGLRSMMLRCFRMAGSYRVECVRAPVRVSVDAVAGRMERPSAPDSEDPADPAWYLPPAVAGRLRARGVERREVELPHMDAAEDLAAALID